MIEKRIRINILLVLIEISIIFAKDEIKKPNDAYDLYWNEPITPESIQIAAIEVTKKIMDADVEPCDDFYEYACGNFEIYNPLSKDQKQINLIRVLQKRIEYNLKQTLLEDVDKKDSNESGSSEEKQESINFDFSHAEIKLKNFIKSCMNLEQIEKEGIKSAIEYLENLDGWPLSELENREVSFDWLNLTTHINQFDGKIVLYNTGEYQSNAEKYLILNLVAGEPYFRDSGRYNMTNESEKNHFYYMYSYLIKSVFKRFGADVNNLGTTINDIIDFEVGLSAFYTEYAESTENDTEITLEKLHEISPGIDWQTYYTTLLGKQLELSEKIKILSEDYIKQLTEYLTNSKPGTIAKYAFFMIGADMIEMMNADLFQTEKRRIKKIKGDRFVQCLQNAEMLMANALSAFFIRRNFYLDSKRDVENMVTEIKTEFYDFINRTDWIDQPHKQLAFNKLDLMIPKIGYEEGLLSHETLNEEYATVDIKEDKYLENTISLYRLRFRKYCDMIGQLANETNFYLPTQMVNAFYNPWDKGAMTFPAGILHPPFYHYYAPSWLKYGAIGSIIGHEMVHAFDSDNMILDSSANVQDFKSLKVIGKYYARSVCMANQYSKFKFKESGTNLDGSQTLDENISDNGGMALALDAYRKWLIRNPDLAENEKIPGLDLSPEQLFFLGHGQVYCEAFSPEALSKIRYYSHAPFKFRLIGSVSNSDSFSAAYNCPFAAPMNPVRKCKYE